MKKYNIAILGSTGAVGREMIQCLFDRKFPVNRLVLLASQKSAGKIQKTGFGDIVIEEVSEKSFKNIDFALLSAGSEISKRWSQIAIDAGAIVVDNSSAFRYDKDILLIVPEVNGESIGDAKLIANPNCTTAIASVVLFPIYKKYGIKKAIFSTYQATSGAGEKGMHELLTHTQHYLNQGEVKNEIFRHPIAFNLIPQIDVFQENGYTKEEMKVVWETAKIFGDESLLKKISVTAVRIPTLRAHSEAITIETEKEVNALDIQELLKKSPGVQVVDNPELGIYPMPKTASHKYDVEVGRVRQNIIFGNYGIDLFVCGDQLLKGAALNAVQICERIIKK